MTNLFFHGLNLKVVDWFSLNTVHGERLTVHGLR